MKQEFLVSGLSGAGETTVLVTTIPGYISTAWGKMKGKINFKMY